MQADTSSPSPSPKQPTTRWEWLKRAGWASQVMRFAIDLWELGA